jgi:peptidoglycan hydrolase-like protein with peptidoglycan-binding domain
MNGGNKMYVEAGSNRIAVRTPIPTQWNGSATLRKGASGQHVKDLQNMLNSAGYKLSVDGQFGNNTYNALVSFQKKSGITADGIAGSGTYSKLKSYHTTTKIIDNSSSGWTGQTLKEGSSGQSVKDLQTLLNRHGFSSGTIDGKYGNDTEAAVKRFQSKVGLKADGIAGSDTYTKLKNYKAPSNSPSSSIWTGQTLREGNSGETVKGLQTMLERAGFDVGSVDGKFGDKTEAAVRAFQKKVGITADGVAGNQTYAHLKSYNPYQTYTPPKTMISNITIENFDKDVKSLVSGKTLEDLFDKAKKWSKDGFDLVIGDDIKTLFNPDANVLDRSLAGLSLLPPGKGLKIGSATYNIIRKGNKVEIAADVFSVTRKGNSIDVKNPVLENIRTGSAAGKTDAHHAFNDIIDNYASYAKKFKLHGSTQIDGVTKDFYQIEGSLNGKKGVFEWIVHPDKNQGVTHRRFIEGIGVTGKPNSFKKK